MMILPQHVLALVVPVILATGIPAVLAAQQRDTALEGVWRFVEEVDHRLDGSLVKTGPAAGYTGLLIFTGTGYMSSTITPKGRTWRRETVTSSELRDTFEGASAHAGRYEPDRTKRTVRMENIVSLDPADEGKWDVVGYRVHDDTLELSGAWTYNGEKLTFAIRLARVR
jgi:lipocalin-like protein